jgi:tyrosine-protein phosphatase SIW14
VITVGKTMFSLSLCVFLVALTFPAVARALESTPRNFHKLVSKMHLLDIALICCICCGVVVAQGCALRPQPPPTHAWAQPCDDCVPGVPNFAIVAEKLWRGSQPDIRDPDIFRKLEQRGVKTIINLRHDHDDFPKLSQTTIHYLWIPMRPWYPEEEDMVIFLSALRRAFADPNKWPVFVHCSEGKDRTGYAIATYRIVEEGWDADDAIHEMFDFHYNPIWFGNPAFLRRIQEKREEIRARLSRVP